MLAFADGALKDTGGWVSLSLALLVLFTNARAATIDSWGKDDPHFTRSKARSVVVLDAVLLAATALVVAALTPLVYDAADELSPGHVRGVVRCLFVLAWGGFVVLALYQGWILRRRLARYRLIRNTLPDGD